MNKIITNLPLITAAAEYFDKEVSSAWKLRATLSNMVVWAGCSYLYARRTNNVAQLATATIRLATLRCWVRDVQSTGFPIDLMEAACAKTMGINRDVDVHEEAKKSARLKCIQARSAAKFSTFYKASIDAHEQKKQERQALVSEVANTLADRQMHISAELANYFEYQRIMSVPPCSFVADEHLYDDAAVERDIDRLSETVGNILEALERINSAQLASAIVVDKITRLSAFDKGIRSMMQIVGVDMSKLASRQTKLDDLIDTEAKKVDVSAKELDASIAAQAARATQTHNLTITPAPQRHLVKSDARTEREAAEALDAATAAAYKKAQAAAKRKAKRSSQPSLRKS